MTTFTNDATYHLFVDVAIAAIIAKVSWLVPGAAPTRAITMEQTLQAFRARKPRLLSMGHSASSILVADGSDRLLLDQLGQRAHADWLCSECDQLGTGPPICQSAAQTRQD